LRRDTEKLLYLHSTSMSTASFFFLWLHSPICAWASSFRGFMVTHLRHTTVGRTPLDEGPARRRDLYLTSHNTHKRQTSMPPVGFEPTILVSERPKTHALDRTATGIGITKTYELFIYGAVHYITNSFCKNVLKITTP
jgi:hypothetical protein